MVCLKVEMVSSFQIVSLKSSNYCFNEIATIKRYIHDQLIVIFDEIATTKPINNLMKRDAELPFYLKSEAGFNDFFSKNYHTACLIALKYVKDYSIAEDLVQDVFITLWEKKENFQIHYNLRNYLFTAVKNHSINLIQRNKSITTSLSELFIDLPDNDLPDSYSQEELAVRVYKAIQELPQACRSIFKLAYEQNYSYQEIADALQISKNTVKTQMGIAYKQLRIKLNCLIVTFLHFIQKK